MSPTIENLIQSITDSKYQRILIVGLPGSGKTSLANTLSTKLNIKHYEMDSILWTENKGGPVNPSFKQDVETIIQNKSWIIEGQYKRISNLIQDKPDLVLKLETPIIITLKRLFIRDLDRKSKGIKQSSDFIWFVKNTLFSRNKKMRYSISHHNVQIIKKPIIENILDIFTVSVL